MKTLKHLIMAALLTGMLSVRGGDTLAERFFRPQPVGSRPNLVFLLSDQQSWDTLGCYGNEQVHTPNLDHLAAGGVRFDSCFSTFPLCTPMRGMLLSGQHPLRNGCVSNDWQLLPGNGPTFASVLRDAGYRTAYIGKWHLYGGDRDRPVPPGPHRHGFDGVFLSNNCAVRFQPEHAFYWDGKEKKLFGEWEQFGQTRQAMDFINQCSAKEPFALFVSWHPPHDHVGSKEFLGYQAPEEYLKRYRAEDVRLRPDQSPDDPRHRVMTRGYFALVDSIDDCFGRIERALRERGLAENTIVVFTSDHGDMLRFAGSQRLIKNRPEPTSCRVPLIIRYPGRLRLRTSELVVGTLDLMPTILGLMELPVPETCEGNNLARAILGGDDTASTETPIFSLLGSPGWRGVVTRDYLYATGFGDDGYNLLVDRKADPYGTRNLYVDANHHFEKQALHKKTVSWMARFGDRGWNYTDLEKVSAVNIQGFKKRSGEIKGRPVDLIRSAGVKGVLDR